MLPETAPFPADQITALNRIIADANAEQRTWLSGFLAGYQAANAPQPAAAAPPARRLPLTILFATESGNAEALADAARKAASKLGFAARVLDMADATPAQLATAQNVLIIASTWGEGDPPQRAVDFHASLMADNAPRLEGLRYAVLALGDRAYAKFCETGRVFDERFAALGATRVAERIECDLDFEAQAATWIDGSLEALQAEVGKPEAGAVIHVDFARSIAGAAWTRTRPSRPRSPNASVCPAAARPRTPGTWKCRWRAPASSTNRVIRSALCRRTIRRWSTRCCMPPDSLATRSCGRNCSTSTTSPR